MRQATRPGPSIRYTICVKIDRRPEQTAEEAIMALKEQRRSPYRRRAASRAFGERRHGSVEGRTTSEIAGALLDYLKTRLGLDELRFLARPRRVSNGWETYIFHFQLQGEPGASATEARASTTGALGDFSGPLTLRVFPYASCAARVQHEFIVLEYLHRLGYPVPAPLCVEAGSAALGGPFLIMEQVPGRTFFDVLLYQPWNMLVLPREMAELLFRLHNLPSAGFPAPAGEFLERALAEIADIIREHTLPGLTAGLDWLAGHRPPPPESPSILHLDFHPLNIMCSSQRRAVVLDWTMADVGDPHADIASTLMLTDCVVPRKRIWQRVGVALGRRFFHWLFLRNSRRLRPLDPEKLSYYQAWAALRRLARAGQLLSDEGPPSDNYKRSAIRNFRPRHVRRLRRYFGERTGVSVSL